MNYVYRGKRKVTNIHDENKQQLIFTQCFIILIILSGRCYYLVDKNTGSKRLSILPKITQLMPKVGLTPSLLFHPLGPPENDRRKDETRQAGPLSKKYTF